MSGRVPDGLRVYNALALAAPTVAAAASLPPRPKLAAADRPKAIRAGERLPRLVRDALQRTPPATGAVGRRPGSPSGWSTRSRSRRATAGGELALSAPEYPGGTLEWYSFDVDPA